MVWNGTLGSSRQQLNIVMSNENNDPNDNNEVANYDYSDAPEWAVPREWFIQGRYDLDNDTSEFTEPL